MDSEWKKIGVVGVDTGRILIADPCYADQKEIRDVQSKVVVAKYSQSLQLNFDIGRPGAGVMVESGMGDGIYSVYAKYEEERVAEVKIDFRISRCKEKEVSNIDELLNNSDKAEFLERFTKHLESADKVVAVFADSTSTGFSTDVLTFNTSLMEKLGLIKLGEDTILLGEHESSDS